LPIVKGVNEEMALGKSGDESPHAKAFIGMGGR
jgi:hypothetical protein